jgi:O-antigen/teichoic acid export membrane protein
MAWLTKGAGAILDQGLFAGTNFVVSILLARWLTAHAFGVFSVVYSVFLLLAAIHTAAVSEPMIVLGAGKYSERLPRFLALTLVWHVAVTVAGAGIVLLASGVLFAVAGRQFAWALLALAAAIPGMLLYWLVRRAFYIRVAPGPAAAGGVLYLLLSVAGVSGLHVADLLSAPAAFLVQGAASAVVSLVLLTRLRVAWTRRDGDVPLAAAIRDFVAYARWSCPTMVLGWIPHNVFYLLMPVFTSVQAAGILRALTNVVMPALNAMTASSALLLPVLSRQSRLGQDRLVRRTTEVAAAVLGGASLVYLWVVLQWGERVVDLAYAGRYSGSRQVMVLLALLPLCYAPIVVYDKSLRATGRMADLFYSYVASTIVAVTTGVLLLWAYGLSGAAAAIVVSTAASACALPFYYYRGLRPCTG